MTIKRQTALAVAVLFALVLSLSALFVALNAEHTCTDDDCAVCQQVASSLSVFHHTSPKPASAFVLVQTVFMTVLCLGALLCGERRDTLIDLKVKLSD